MCVRNRIIEIQRLTNHTQWKYVESKNNIADIGTRKGAKLCDVGPCSEWALGKRWMRGNAENSPLKAVVDLVLSPGEEDNASKESIVIEELSGPNTSLHMPKGIGEADLEDQVEKSYSDQVFFTASRNVGMKVSIFQIATRSIKI